MKLSDSRYRGVTVEFITLYPAMLEIGIGLPFQPSVYAWLSEFSVAIAQISRNGYRIIIALMTLWREHYGCDPLVEVLRHHLRLRKNISTTRDPINGFYCITSHRPSLIIDVPPVAKTWRNKWFDAKGWSPTASSGSVLAPKIITHFMDAGCMKHLSSFFVC